MQDRLLLTRHGPKQELIDSASTRPVHRGSSGGLGRRLRLSPRGKFVIRYAVAITAAVAVSQIPGLVTSESKWIVVTTVSVVLPLTGGALVQALLRLIGTLAAALVAIGLVGLFAQDPPLMFAGFFLVQVVSAYGFTGSRYQYAPYCFAFTTGIILGDVMAGKGLVETVAFERASMVVIGILIALVAEILFWPTEVKATLRGSLADRARVLGRALRDGVVPGRTTGETWEEAAPGSNPLVEQLALIDPLRAEFDVSHAEVTALTHMALQLEALASRVQMLSIPSAPGATAAAQRPEEESTGIHAELGRSLEAALDEVAEALEDERLPDRFAADLAERLRAVEAERDRGERSQSVSPAEDHVEALRDLPRLFTNLEETLIRLASDDVSDAVAERSPGGTKRGFRLDPFRVKTSLRVGVAVCASYLAMIALGWEANMLILQVAFRGASPPTRGGGWQRLMAVAVTVAIVWALTDLAIVFMFPHTGRLGLSLLFPLLLAGGFAYWRYSRPAYKDVNDNALQVGLVPAFGGLAAPMDVYGAYSTVCIVSLGAFIGWIATRLLWPTSAATLFRARTATQIELALEAMRQLGPDSPWTQSDELLRAYGRELGQIGSLHGQASHEPVDGVFDDARRARLAVLTQNLFEAALAATDLTPGQLPTFFEGGDPALASLRESLLRFDEALVASMESCAAAVRGEAPGSGSGLASALEDARGAFDAVGPEFDQETMRIQLEARQSVMACQLAVEVWVSDWREAGGRS